MEKLSWEKKYELSLDEHIGIKGIQMLLDCGQTCATAIRNKVIAYCEDNNIIIIGKYVPTDIVLKVTNRDRSYFYLRMLDEKKLPKA